MTVKRVLIGANTFGTALIPGIMIHRGDIIEVSQEIADNLDSHARMDSANNAHSLFVDVTDARAAKYVSEEDAAPPPVKKTRKKRAVKKSVSEAVAVASDDSGKGE